MPKILPIHYKTLIKIFEMDGFTVQRMKGDHVIQRAERQPRGLRKLVRGIQCVPRRIERMIKRPLAARRLHHRQGQEPTLPAEGDMGEIEQHAHPFTDEPTAPSMM